MPEVAVSAGRITWGSKISFTIQVSRKPPTRKTRRKVRSRADMSTAIPKLGEVRIASILSLIAFFGLEP